jgi:cyclophilin family peptidyl-prolyl cis-trans isomerase
VSDQSPTPQRLPFSLASGALLIGALVVAIIFINRANSPNVAPASASGTPSVATSASAGTATTIPFANCTTATFGAALQPSGQPADRHVYSAAPPMQIDSSTAKGAIVLCLQPSLAPNTVNNFVVLVRNHYYDGLTFHRVVAGFVIQGGDPKGDGSGGPGYKFNDEPVHQAYVQGALAMANSGINTNGSQFFICTADDTTKLQPLYNLFGQVVSGLTVVLSIQQGDVLQTVTVAQSQ